VPTTSLPEVRSKRWNSVARRARAFSSVALKWRHVLIRHAGSIEGARLGESSGKALVAIAEEVRNLSSRGLDIVATHIRLVEEAEVEQAKLIQASELAQSLAMELANMLRLTQECQIDAQASLDMLEKAIERASGLDATTALEVQRVAEHGQGLLSALEGLSVSRRQKIAKTMLLPAVEPLLRALLQVAQADAQSEPEP
jgi:hypothetical protein